ncbi:MAG: hypothetical protein U9O24_07045 [Campylobacterota bacterium]|nr:hypothetical protein [Campylobacterota bacterium]
MKHKLLVICVIVYGIGISLYAKCDKVPDGTELNKVLKAKNYDKSEELFKIFKSDIENYLSKCNNSEAVVEETQLSILTFKDRLSDLKYELEKGKSTANIDCSLSPSSGDIEKAFREKDAEKIKILYAKYKKEADKYMNDCSSHEEYEFVFETALLLEEQYAEWEKGL